MADGDPADRPSAEPAPALDVVIPHSPTPDGDGMRVVRFTDDAVSFAEVRPLEEGVPITGDVVKLSPSTRRGAYHVEVLIKRDRPRLAAPSAAADGSERTGPAQVATEDYRRNWEAVFGVPVVRAADDEDDVSDEDSN